MADQLSEFGEVMISGHMKNVSPQQLYIHPARL